MEEIDLKELFQIFWEKKIQIAIITGAFILVGLVYTLFCVTPKYEASTTLLLATNSMLNRSIEQINGKTTTVYQQEGITTTDITVNSKLVSTYSVLVKSDRIIRKVISNLNLNMTENQIRNSVNVTAVSDTEVIKISVKDVDAEIATKIANEIANEFIETVKEFYGIENVHIVDKAEVPIEPCNINHLKDIVIFTFIGIVVSAFYVFVLTMIDTRIKSAEVIEDKLKLPVLAVIPSYNLKEERKERRKMK